jgi:AcrR family transcriptional regulator
VTTRDKLLDAAASLMRDQGLANVKTRHIASLAGYTEATLYKHFIDKVDLMLAVLSERSTAFTALAEALARTTGDLETRLTAIARALIDFYSDNFPMLASIFADRKLLETHKDGLRDRDAGPYKVNEALMRTLQREVEAGTIRADADLYGAAGLLVGACMQHAFLGHMGWPDRLTDKKAATSFVRTLLTAVAS